MPEDVSPYSRPMQSAQQPPSSTNTVAIVAIISVTTLLICGGVIGLGFYAVDRMAEQLAEFESFDEQESAFAVEFAIEENEVIRDRVGEIEQVDHDESLTYHEDADLDDYFYRVNGSSGEAVVVVQFSMDDQRWFSSVQLIEGNEVNDPRTTLQARRAPFDTEWSRSVYEALIADDHAAAELLNLGDIEWITYEFDESTELQSDQELVFEVDGDKGSVSLLAEFKDSEYVEVQSLHVVDGDGKQQETIYTAEADVEESVPAEATETL